MKINKIILFIFLFLGLSLKTFSLDTRGKDFWFNFLPNMHAFQDEENDSLLIFIAAEVPTNCTLEYRDYLGKVYKNNFRITNPKQVYTFKLYWRDFELRGINYLSAQNNNSQCERVALQNFHLTSDENISVIGHSKARLSNDAFLIFPIQSLGKEYYIMSYNSDPYNNSASHATPSEFSITAVEDNTTIDIYPKCQTYRYGLETQKVVLNKGESYLVQAKMNMGFIHLDLTGSYIKSDKVIAVFSGHQRAAIPIKTQNNSPSRDIIVEQMVPVNFWGINAFIIPFNPIKVISQYGTDLFRIMAASDSTELFLNGELVAILNAGEFYEGALDGIYHAEASGPILVAEYKKTSGDQITNSGSNEFVDGDPFMVIVPPKEQFSRIYRCINAQVYDYDKSGQVEASFREQYITLVAPDKALQSVKIDGVPVQIANFKPINKSGYSVINAKVKDGTHDVTCDEEVGIFIYGYGPANSYGYIGGMSSKNIDFNPPFVSYKLDCSGFEITAIDTNIYDSGIDSIIAPANLNSNIAFNIPQHSDTTHFYFKASVIDKFKDATLNVIIKDSIGYYRRIKKEIKGFTLSLNSVSDTLTVIDTLSGKKVKCYDLEIKNYGKFIQDYDLKFAQGNSKLTLSKSGKLKLLPGQTQKIQVCYDALRNPSVNDSLIIGDSCVSKMIAVFNLNTVADTISPIIEKFDDPCLNLHTVDIFDSLKYDTGIKEVQILEAINCSLTQDINTLERFKYNITIQNRSKDAVYSINAIDVWGNSKSFTSTIKAIDLAFSYFNADSSSDIIFKDKVIGEVYQDSLKVSNQTENTIVIENINLIRNVEFSIPQSQFPITLNSLESKNIYVLFHPSNYYKNNIFSDSIRIEVNCQYSYIKLKGTSLAFEMNGNNRCGQITKLTSNYKPNKLALNNISPNPSGGLVNLSFETAGKENLIFEVFDLIGTKKTSFNFNIIENGIYDLEFDLKDLESGVYYGVLSNNKDSYFKSIVIKK